MFQRRSNQSKPHITAFVGGEIEVGVGNKESKKKKTECDPDWATHALPFSADNQKTHLLAKPRLNRPWSLLAILVSPACAAWHQ